MANGVNEEFDTLIDLIDEYCEDELNASRGISLPRESSRELKALFIESFPHLAALFSSAPDVIYIRQIMDYSVKGLEQAAHRVVWDVYFRKGKTLDEVAHQATYSVKTIRRYVDSFPEYVATYWWEKNLELGTSPPSIEVEPKTIKACCMEALEKKYSLTERQCEVLFAFCINKDKGRRELAKELFISENTLKTHISRILKAMRKTTEIEPTTMNDAVRESKKMLEKEVGASWGTYFRGE